MATPSKIRDALLDKLAASPAIRGRLALEASAWKTFRPRPDRPEKFDQQTAFCQSKDAVAFLIGGNGSGTTEAAAHKTARLVLRDQPPPRKDTPFWVISNTYEQVCGVCWQEKLSGHGHIPECEVEWDRIRWLNSGMNWPLAVPLKPWPGRPGTNWMLEFKSYEQGRRALQARSVGGFWFSEQFPLDLLLEVLRGCREYMFPGAQFAEFTPIEPELCLWIERLLDDPPEGWGFYRCNTEMNKPNLADGWYDNFFASVPDEMVATRKTGALATFEGVIYQTFQPAVHVLHGPLKVPKGGKHYRSFDWGSSAEHPFVCLWGYRDGMGDWTIYREYWDNRQDQIVADRAQAIQELSGRRQYEASYGDPSRPDQMNEFSAAGIPVFAASNKVYEGIDCIRAFLKLQENTNRPRLRIHESCTHLIEEMRKYRWLKTRKATDGGLNPQVARPVPLKRDDDTVDALRYMIYTVERTYGAVPGSTSYRDYAARKEVQLHRRRR